MPSVHMLCLVFPRNVMLLPVFLLVPIYVTSLQVTLPSAQFTLIRMINDGVVRVLAASASVPPRSTTSAATSGIPSLVPLSVNTSTESFFLKALWQTASRPLPHVTSLSFACPEFSSASHCLSRTQPCSKRASLLTLKEAASWRPYFAASRLSDEENFMQVVDSPLRIFTQDAAIARPVARASKMNRAGIRSFMEGRK